MITIADFYVDEPACLGVPPYLSPYCRYVAGALVAGGIPPEKISYLTVDQWRSNGKELADDPELVVLIAGSTVPGKYLGGRIGTVAEIKEFLEYRSKYQKGAATVLGGPIRHASDGILWEIASRGGIVVDGDIELAVEMIAADPAGIRAGLSRFVGNGNSAPFADLRRSYQQVDRWAVAGAFLTLLHPNFPFLMIELETYRGCTRKTHCSFCTEAFYGKPDFRSTRGIVGEVEELYSLGNRYFRLGRQADLLTYGSDPNRYRNGFPQPRPEEIETLYSGIRRVAPDLKVLHLDNINPGAVAAFETEAAEIVRTITRYNTPGDTAAMGLETVDPVVFGVNGLKCDRQQAIRAIEIVNQAGIVRTNGIPRLLPGLNFIHGLPGESDSTFQRNFEFLEELLDRNLLLRRINIRQVIVHKNTRLERLRDDPDLYGNIGISKKRRKPAVLENKFVHYRDRIRREIDRPMLERVFPPGTVLREVIPEMRNPGYVLGRQLGSYPVTVKVPLSDPIAASAFDSRRPMDVIVTGHKERSLLGITYPIQVNLLGRSSLAQIPGIGGKRASSLVLSRPFRNIDEFSRVIEGLQFGQAADYVFSKREMSS
ncbi:MAG: radical SAM protein [Proteobacteria bacterium]|nr:radical SAM protein [Pseudomonadota bacterium]